MIQIDINELEACAKAVCRRSGDLLDPEEVANAAAVILLEGRQKGNPYGACRSAAWKLRKLRGFVHRKASGHLERVEYPSGDLDDLGLSEELEEFSGRFSAQEDAVVALVDYSLGLDR